MAAAAAGSGGEPPRKDDMPELGEENMEEEDDEEEEEEDAKDSKVPRGLLHMKIGTSKISKKIEALRVQRDKLKSEQATATKELKKQRRTQARLRTKAQKLDNNDLMEVFRLRMEAQAKAKAKAEAKSPDKKDKAGEDK